MSNVFKVEIVNPEKSFLSREDASVKRAYISSINSLLPDKKSSKLSEISS